MFAGADSRVAVLKGFSCSSRSCSCFKLISWSVNCSDRGARGDFSAPAHATAGRGSRVFPVAAAKSSSSGSNVGIVAVLVREILGVPGEAQCGVRNSSVSEEKDQGCFVGCPWSLLPFVARDGAPLGCVPSCPSPAWGQGSPLPAQNVL